MRKAISVAALILALTCSVYAGEMPNGAPQPPPPAEQQEPKADDAGEPGAADSFKETVLSVLESLLALL